MFVESGSLMLRSLARQHNMPPTAHSHLASNNGGNALYTLICDRRLGGGSTWRRCRACCNAAKRRLRASPAARLSDHCSIPRLAACLGTVRGIAGGYKT